MAKRKPLRHLLNLYQPIDTVTAKGDRITVYPETPNAQTYGSIDTLAGRELVVAKGIRADLTHSITMRWVASCNHRTMLTWDDGTYTHYYHLGPAVDSESRQSEMSFYVVEIVKRPTITPIGLVAYESVNGDFLAWSI